MLKPKSFSLIGFIVFRVTCCVKKGLIKFWWFSLHVAEVLVTGKGWQRRFRNVDRGFRDKWRDFFE